MVVYSLFYILQNKKGTDLVLGVDAHGINIYEPNDVKKPKITFPWNEVQNVAYNDKKVGYDVYYFSCHASAYVRT